MVLLLCSIPISLWCQILYPNSLANLHVAVDERGDHVLADERSVGVRSDAAVDEGQVDEKTEVCVDTKMGWRWSYTMRALWIE